MVRVGEDQEILHPRAFVMSVHGTADNALEYYPNESKHHYGAEPSFHRSVSQRNAALVLVRLTSPPEHVQNRL